MIRVRIAPSPTGFAHVGTAYTALFNYAFARHNKGTFVVRVEDTDVKRNVKGAEAAIFEGLKWLGIDWDEGGEKGGKYGPYRQSEKLKTYQKIAKDLVRRGLAYEEEGAIRFKNPGKDVSWDDLVRGKITFPGGEVTNFVILKSDGYPTYNFGVVVDDLDMEITHVIRGEEHISNTPRQLALYDAMGAKPPLFAHHVTLRNAERKKLSKRRDPVDLRIYKDEGYLPEALVNFLCNLGFSHPEGKEIYSLGDYVKLFDFNRVRSAGPVFDITKLDWINGEYIRRLSVESLNDKFQKTNDKFKKLDKEKQLMITKLVQERIKKLSEFNELAGFFFEVRKPSEKDFGKNHKEHLRVAREVLEKDIEWKKETIDEVLMNAVKENNFKTGDFFMDLRVAVCGKRFTPPINDSIVILGKEESLKRLKE